MDLLLPQATMLQMFADQMLDQHLYGSGKKNNIVNWNVKKVNFYPIANAVKVEESDSPTLG